MYRDLLRKYLLEIIITFIVLTYLILSSGCMHATAEIPGNKGLDRPPMKISYWRFWNYSASDVVVNINGFEVKVGKLQATGAEQLLQAAYNAGIAAGKTAMMP